MIHEPARLAIMTALASCHIAKLEESGLIQVEKRSVEKRPNTLVQITEKGRLAIEQHWKQLDELRKGTQKWKP